MSEQYYENDVIEMQDEDFVEVENTTETSKSNGLLGWAIGLGATAIVGGIALYKNRDKIKQAKVNKQIKKLEQQGYCVSRPISAIEVVPNEVDNEETEED